MNTEDHDRIETPEHAQANASGYGYTMIAMFPAVLALISIAIFDEKYSTGWGALSSLGWYFPVLACLLAIVSQARLQPKRFFLPVSNARFFIIFGITIFAFIFTSQETILNSVLLLISRIENGALLWAFGTALVVAQALLLFEAVRIAVVWRCSATDQKEILLNDRLLREMPSVEQLRRKLSRLSSDQNNS